MKTEELIDRLAERAEPVAPGAALRILATGLGGGAAVSVLVMLFGLGVRPDFAVAVTTSDYWVKFIYLLLFAVLAFRAVERLARPGVEGRVSAILFPFLGMALLALWSWRTALPATHAKILFGGSHIICPWLIVLLALPIFAGIFWALRQLAPTKPVLAGTVGGLAAGAAGAFIYALHCNENGLPFVAIWYTLGIIIVGGLGASFGRSLRW